MQPWYSDNIWELDTFGKIQDYFNPLTQAVLKRRYYSKPTKSVLIVHLENIEAVILFGAHHGFKFCTCYHYLVGFIWNDSSKREWLIGRDEVWKKNISTISKNVVKYQQENYVAIAHEIQP